MINIHFSFLSICGRLKVNSSEVFKLKRCHLMNLCSLCGTTLKIRTDCIFAETVARFGHPFHILDETCSEQICLRESVEKNKVFYFFFKIYECMLPVIL